MTGCNSSFLDESKIHIMGCSFLFLRRLLIVSLVGVFICVGTFPTQAEALVQANQSEEGVSVHPPFQNPYFIDADKYKITLEAVNGKFTIEGDGTTPPTYDGLLYKASYSSKMGKTDSKDCSSGSKLDEKSKSCEYPSLYNPPTIVVSPNSTIELRLKNSLPVSTPQVGKLPPVEYNIESVSEDTNLHYHGFNVSPLLGSDNVVMHVHSSNTSKQQKVSIDTKKYQTIPIQPKEDDENPLPDNYIDREGGKYPGDNSFSSITEYSMKVNIPQGHQKGL